MVITARSLQFVRYNSPVTIRRSIVPAGEPPEFLSRSDPRRHRHHVTFQLRLRTVFVGINYDLMMRCSEQEENGTLKCPLLLTAKQPWSPVPGALSDGRLRRMTGWAGA